MSQDPTTFVIITYSDGDYTTYTLPGNPVIVRDGTLRIKKTKLFHKNMSYEDIFDMLNARQYGEELSSKNMFGVLWLRNVLRRFMCSISYDAARQLWKEASSHIDRVSWAELTSKNVRRILKAYLKRSV